MSAGRKKDETMSKGTSKTPVTVTLSGRALDAAIVARRVRAGGSAERCCVCCRPAAAPYRAFVDGVLTYGCIDATHGAHVSGADLEWHDRPAAEQLRRGWLAHELTF